jgi:hypothetical protein
MHELADILFEQKGRYPIVLISCDVIDYYVYGLDLVVSKSIVDGVAIIIFLLVVFLCYFVPIEDGNFGIKVLIIQELLIFVIISKYRVDGAAVEREDVS